MSDSTTTSTLHLTGRIDTQVHDVGELEAATDEPWDTLSGEEKLALTRDVAPAYSDTVYNVTTEGLHEYFVDNLNPNDSANHEAAWLGLGTNASGGTALTDTDLNTRTYEETLTNVADNGTELLASTFLDSTEANGNVFNELGIFTGNPANLSDDGIFMLNHATFSNVTKDSSKTVTFDVTLSFAGN